MSFLGLLQATAIVAIAFSLLTAIDIPHRNVELFTHFRLQYFVATLLLLIIFAVLKNLPFAAAMLLVTLFNGSFIVHWFLPGNRLSGGSEELKLLHINVHSSNDQYARLTELVSRENPDMVFLQEVTSDWVVGVQGLLREYPHSYIEARGGNFGIALYSKIPFDTATHFDSPPFAYPTIVASITKGDRSVTLVSTHPTIPLGRILYNARNEHLRSVAELVSGLSGDRVLLGDFNTSIWGPRNQKLLEATGLENARRGFGVLPTWPTLLPIAMIPIDHVYVSDGIGVSDMKTGRAIGSDHLPLIVTLSL